MVFVVTVVGMKMNADNHNLGRDPEDKISDVANYSAPSHRKAVTSYMVSIPLDLLYKLFRLWRRKR